MFAVPLTVNAESAVVLPTSAPKVTEEADTSRECEPLASIVESEEKLIVPPVEDKVESLLTVTVFV